MSQAPEAVGDYVCEDAIHLTQHSPRLSNQLLLLAGCNLKRGAGHTLGLGSASSTQNSPLQGFLCAGVPYCSNVIRPVRAVIFLYIYVCLGGLKQIR